MIDGLSPTSKGADIQNSAMAASFRSNKDPAADLTVFLVRRAFDGAIPVSGVTDAKAGFALIGDNRSETTLAHEAGHFLGALNEHGKFSEQIWPSRNRPGLTDARWRRGTKDPVRPVRISIRAIGELPPKLRNRRANGCYSQVSSRTTHDQATSSIQPGSSICWQSDTKRLRKVLKSSPGAPLSKSP